MSAPTYEQIVDMYYACTDRDCWRGHWELGPDELVELTDAHAVKPPDGFAWFRTDEANPPTISEVSMLLGRPIEVTTGPLRYVAG